MEIFPETYETMASEEIKTLKEMVEHVKCIREYSSEMVEARKVCNRIQDISEKAKCYCREVEPFLNKIRTHIDKLELIVDNNLWPMPKYRELMDIH